MSAEILQSALLAASRGMPVFPVETSRGCPYDCAICSEVSYWGKPVRYRAIPDVIDELSYDVSAFGVRTFRFADSCFSAPPQPSCGLARVKSIQQTRLPDSARPLTEACMALGS